ncbi:hypothetical protein JW877_05735 [bacterium]|nr:hypothetical protein [bacterium]
MAMEKTETEFGWRAVIRFIIAVLLVAAFILLLPTREKDYPIPDRSRIDFDALDKEALQYVEDFVEELEVQGFEVVNNYPFFMEVTIGILYENAEELALEFSRKLYEGTGENVKIILEANSEKYIGYYKPPSEK